MHRMFLCQLSLNFFLFLPSHLWYAGLIHIVYINPRYFSTVRNSCTKYCRCNDVGNIVVGKIYIYCTCLQLLAASLNTVYI
jgi:hypothetical protein